MSPTIRHVCAKCKKVLGYTDSFGAPGGISHGLCPRCRDAVLEEAGLEPELEDHDRDCDCRACRTDRLNREGDQRYDQRVQEGGAR